MSFSAMATLDLERLENAKENVQPLRSGRKAAILNASLAVAPRDLNEQIEAKMRYVLLPLDIRLTSQGIRGSYQKR